MAKDSKTLKPPVVRQGPAWAMPTRQRDPSTHADEVDFSGPPKGKPKRILRVDPDKPR